MVFMAELFYVNYQPQAILIQADDVTIAMAAAYKFAAMNGGALDKRWPGTKGWGVGLSVCEPSARQLRKFRMIRATPKAAR
jgi:hypothetical protein